MTDTSDITAAEQRRGGWIGRHWRGELSLGAAFWVNTFLLNGAFSLLYKGLAYLMGDDPGLGAWLAVQLLLAFEAVMRTWQVVGVWRSAGRFPGRRMRDGTYVGRRLWSVAARVVSVLWCVLGLLLVAAAFKVSWGLAG